MEIPFIAIHPPYENPGYDAKQSDGEVPVMLVLWGMWSTPSLPPPNESPGYDTKQSDGEVPVMLELWGMWSTSSLPSLPGST